MAARRGRHRIQILLHLSSGSHRGSLTARATGEGSAVEHRCRWAHSFDGRTQGVGFAFYNPRPLSLAGRITFCRPDFGVEQRTGVTGEQQPGRRPATPMRFR